MKVYGYMKKVGLRRYLISYLSFSLEKFPDLLGFCDLAFGFYAILALKYIGFYQNPPFSGGFYC